MIRHWLDKRWVQIAALLTVVGLMVYYWGFVFEFGYRFDWGVLFTVNQTYDLHLGMLILQGVLLTVKITLVSSVLALALGTFFGLARFPTFRPIPCLPRANVGFFGTPHLLIKPSSGSFPLPPAFPVAPGCGAFAARFRF